VELYPFQQYTVTRLREVRSSLIGDDMGLGKTIQAIALDIERRKMNDVWATGKTLVITPLGVVRSWVEQFQKWAPHLNVIAINPRNRTPFETAVELGTHDVYIMHWDVVRIMPVLAQRKWFHVVGDEIHRIQNRQAKVSVAVKEIEATFKTGLSGTPAFDKPDDLWSVLNWLYPTYWTSYWKYFNHHVLWVDYNGYKTIIGVANEQELHDKMRGFYIRRKKEEVLTDLPDVYYTEKLVELTPKQRRAYNQMRDSMLSWVGENEDKPVAAPQVVAQLTRLQQFAAAHGEVVIEEKPKRIGVGQLNELYKGNPGQDIDGEGYIVDRITRERIIFKTEKMVLADPSSKIDAALEILESTHKPVVFFSQFSQVIELFCARLEKHGISYGKYTGATPNRERTDIIERFQAGQLRVFAATLGAGGTGIDGLQLASDTCVFFDRSWSHSTNEQAIGRLHRIGQKNAVQVIDLIATGTIERKRIQKIQLEWEWIRALLGELPE
jgi:SNF2 family DNA or RNA helicase